MRTSARFWTRVPMWILVVAVILIAARAALPSALKWYINRTLDSIPGYYGRVADVDVSLWRGGYQIQGVKLVKVNGNEQEPFFSAREVDISLDWRALWNRRLVTKISLFHPQLQFIQRKTAETSQTSVDESWQEKVKGLYPFEINRFVIREGLIRYKDQTRDPKINFYLRDLNLDSENISNATKSSDRLPSSILANGRFLDTGRFRLQVKADMLSEPAEGDVNASVRGLALKEINDFAKAYGNFDFEKGTLDVALELAASKKRYDGYVKTLMQGVDVVDFSKELKKGDSVGHLLWDGLVGAIAEIFENQKRDRFAARIPIAGSREEMTIDSWATLGSVLRNAFVRSLSPELEDTIDFSDVSRKPSSAESDDKGDRDQGNN